MTKIIQRVKYSIRNMEERDIPQALELDREAFPTQWPYPTYSSFKQELNNRLAYYIVAYTSADNAVFSNVIQNNSTGGRNFFDKVFGLFHISQTFNARQSILPPPARDYILGMAGFWLMVGEAHIITIAVRNDYRRQGIGTRMLIYIIERAIELNANFVTLEVRVSNVTAQLLYKKFGFSPTGIRYKYYTDNNENALIMSTDDINSPVYSNRLKSLKEAHDSKWGNYVIEPIGGI